MKKAVVYRFAIALLLILLPIAGWFIFKQNKRHGLPRHEHGHRDSETERTIEGKVVHYAANPGGDIDRILINAGNHDIWIHFPPHTARQVVNVASLNKTIFATIQPHNGPEKPDSAGFELVSLKSADSKQKINLDDISPPSPKIGSKVEITGSRPELVEKIGSPEKSFVLDGNLISLPPHMANSLFPLIKNARKILVKGFKRDSSDGFVKISGLPYIKPYSIQIDSVTYLVR